VPEDTTASVPKGETAGVLEDYEVLEADVATETAHYEHDNSPTNQPSSNDDNTEVIEGDYGYSGDKEEDDASESDGEETEHTEITDSEVYHPETMTPSIQRVHGLRPRHYRNDSHLHANIVHHAMAQYSLKKGLEKFKGKAEEAMSK
jgi:hypothetical protein